MGMNYLLSGDKDKAISILNNILEEEPNNADVLALLAFAYCEREDICQDFVNKALELEPDNANAIAILGRIYDNRTNY
jgi:Tfp pilus assembly protein PilF